MVEVRFSIKNVKGNYSIKWYDGSIKEIPNTDDFTYAVFSLEEALSTSGAICMLNREIIKSFEIRFYNGL